MLHLCDSAIPSVCDGNKEMSYHLYYYQKVMNNSFIFYFVQSINYFQ